MDPIARDEGFHAYYQDVLECPYTPETTAHNEWWNGWNDASDDNETFDDEDVLEDEEE